MTVYTRRLIWPRFLFNYEDERANKHFRNSRNRFDENLNKLKNAYLHLFAIDVKSTNSEIHPNGVLLFLHEYARLEALDHAGLPHIRVPDQDDFE